MELDKKHFLSWWRSPTIWLVLVAVVYALPSLTYPFGRDQAMHYYVGRWWLEGFVPYRDSFDMKPPLIYVVHALSVFLFGTGQVGIRILDLLATLLAGVLTAFAVNRNRPLQAGELGTIILVTVAFYYTCFDYWDTAQPERFEGLMLLASYLAAVRLRRLWLASAVSGALSVGAILFKLPAVLPALGIALLIGIRALRTGDSWGKRFKRLIFAALLYLLPGLVTVAVFAAYFALKGGFDELVDVSFMFPWSYARRWHISVPQGLFHSYQFWLVNNSVWTIMLLLAWVSGLIMAVRRKDWNGLGGMGSTTLMLVMAIASVVCQQYFFSYHWIVVTPFLVLGAVSGISQCIQRWRWVTIVVTLLAVEIGFVSAGPWQTQLAYHRTHPLNYPKFCRSVFLYVSGKESRDTFLGNFVGGYEYRYKDQEIIGNMVRNRAHQGDRLLVKGYEPAIYAVADLPAPSRFAADHFLFDRFFHYKRRKWRVEHERALRKNPPRFVVCFPGKGHYLDRLKTRNYQEVANQGNFLLLERAVPVKVKKDPLYSERLK